MSTALPHLLGVASAIVQVTGNVIPAPIPDIVGTLVGAVSVVQAVVHTSRRLAPTDTEHSDEPPRPAQDILSMVTLLTLTYAAFASPSWLALLRAELLYEVLTIVLLVFAIGLRRMRRDGVTVHLDVNCATPFQQLLNWVCTATSTMADNVGQHDASVRGVSLLTLNTATLALRIWAAMTGAWHLPTIVANVYITALQRTGFMAVADTCPLPAPSWIFSAFNLVLQWVVAGAITGLRLAWGTMMSLSALNLNVLHLSIGLGVLGMVVVIVNTRNARVQAAVVWLVSAVINFGCNALSFSFNLSIGFVKMACTMATASAWFVSRPAANIGPL
jgi:hypothetical protein